MYSLKEFWRWITRASDKAEKLEFKSQREAADFVRRLYNKNGAPNERLRELYNQGDKLEKNGTVKKGAGAA